MSVEITQPSTNLDLHSAIDALEVAMLNHPSALVDMPVIHRFTPGMYIREIFNPAGTLITTKIHKVEHPFVILRGHIETFVIDEDDTQTGHTIGLSAPHFGITHAGTRRVILVLEDTVFITFHPNPTNTQDLDELESMLIEQRTMSGSTSTANEAYRNLLARNSVQEISS